MEPLTQEFFRPKYLWQKLCHFIREKVAIFCCSFFLGRSGRSWEFGLKYDPRRKKKRQISRHDAQIYQKMFYFLSQKTV